MGSTPLSLGSLFKSSPNLAPLTGYSFFIPNNPPMEDCFYLSTRLSCMPMNELFKAKIVAKKTYLLVNRDKCIDMIVVKIEARTRLLVPPGIRGDLWLEQPSLQLPSPSIETNPQPRFVAMVKKTLDLPKPFGRFIFDILGRHEIADSSSIILGWIVVSIILLLFRGFIPLEVLINWLISLGDSFLR